MSTANAAVRKPLQAFKVCSTELKSLFRRTPTCLADATIGIGSSYNVRLHVIFFRRVEYKSTLLFAGELYYMILLIVSIPLSLK